MKHQIELSEAECERIALDWLREQGKAGPKGYEKPLRVLFGGLHMAQWAWTDAIRFVVQFCSKSYFIDIKTILKAIQK